MSTSTMNNVAGSQKAPGKGRSGRKQWIPLDLFSGDNLNPTGFRQESPNKTSKVEISESEALNVKSLGDFPTLSDEITMPSSITNGKTKSLGFGPPMKITCPLDYLLRAPKSGSQVQHEEAASMQNKVIYDIVGHTIGKSKPVVRLPGKAAYPSKAEKACASVEERCPGFKHAAPIFRRHNSESPKPTMAGSIMFGSLEYVLPPNLATKYKKAMQTSVECTKYAISTTENGLEASAIHETAQPVMTAGSTIKFGDLEFVLPAQKASETKAEQTSAKEIQHSVSKSEKSSMTVSTSGSETDSTPKTSSTNTPVGNVKLNDTGYESPSSIDLPAKEGSTKVTKLNETIPTIEATASTATGVVVRPFIPEPSTFLDIPTPVVASSSANSPQKRVSLRKDIEKARKAAKKAADQAKHKAKAEEEKAQREKTKQTRLAKERESCSTVTDTKSRDKRVESESEKPDHSQTSLTSVSELVAEKKTPTDRTEDEKHHRFMAWLCEHFRRTVGFCYCVDLSHCQADEHEKTIRQTLWDAVEKSLMQVSEDDDVSIKTPSTVATSDVATEGDYELVSEYEYDSEVGSIEEELDLVTDLATVQEGNDPMAFIWSSSHEEIEADHSCSDVLSNPTLAQRGGDPMAFIWLQSEDEKEPSYPRADALASRTIAQQGCDPMAWIWSRSEEDIEPDYPRPDVLSSRTMAQEGSNPMAFVWTQSEETKEPDFPRSDSLANRAISQEGGDPMAWIWCRSPEDMELDYPRSDPLTTKTISQEGGDPMSWIWSRSLEKIEPDYPRSDALNSKLMMQEGHDVDQLRKATSLNETDNESQAFYNPGPSSALILHNDTRNEKADGATSKLLSDISAATKIGLSMSIPKLLERGILPTQMGSPIFSIPFRTKAPSPLSKTTFPEEQSAENLMATKDIAPTTVPSTFTTTLPIRTGVPGSFKRAAKPASMGLPIRTKTLSFNKKEVFSNATTTATTPFSPQLSSVVEEEEVVELPRIERDTGVVSIRFNYPQTYIVPLAHGWATTPETPQPLLLCTQPQITAQKLVCGSGAGSSEGGEREYYEVDGHGGLVRMDITATSGNNDSSEDMPGSPNQELLATHILETSDNVEASEDSQAILHLRNTSGSSSETIMVGTESDKENHNNSPTEAVTSAHEPQNSAGEDSGTTMIPTALLNEMMAKIQRLEAQMEHINSTAAATTQAMAQAALNKPNLVMSGALNLMHSTAMKQNLCPDDIRAANVDLTSKLPARNDLNKDELKSFAEKSQAIAMLANNIAFHAGWLLSSAP